jgi:hypothetical protein
VIQIVAGALLIAIGLALIGFVTAKMQEPFESVTMIFEVPPDEGSRITREGMAFDAAHGEMSFGFSEGAAA